MPPEDDDIIRRLFAKIIPEVAEGVVEIKAIAREAGTRTKVAIHSLDRRVDCIGACVGVRGTRIRQIVEQMNGERIDLVKWDEQIDKFIGNALQPSEIDEIRMDYVQRKAMVIVKEDQKSLAVGRRGQNQRLAGKLCGYEIEIISSE